MTNYNTPIPDITLNRRSLLRGALLGAGALAVPTVLGACEAPSGSRNDPTVVIPKGDVQPDAFKTYPRAMVSRELAASDPNALIIAQQLQDDMDAVSRDIANSVLKKWRGALYENRQSTLVAQRGQGVVILSVPQRIDSKDSLVSATFVSDTYGNPQLNGLVSVAVQKGLDPDSPVGGFARDLVDSKGHKLALVEAKKAVAEVWTFNSDPHGDPKWPLDAAEVAHTSKELAVMSQRIVAGCNDLRSAAV